jgi:hypothetical protein
LSVAYRLLPIALSVMEKVLLRNIGVADSHTLAVYQARGGYGAWR